MNLFELIKKERISLNISQQELAGKAEVSLTTLQNIEAGHSNPSIAIIEKLATQLNLGIALNSCEYNWDLLSSTCLPVSTMNKKKTIFNVNKIELMHQIKLGCRDIIKRETSDNKGRIKVAMESLLLAIRDHYPTTFKRYLSKSSDIKQLIPSVLTGKHLKLRRIAISNIGHYL